MENSFFIPINSGSLAHYFSRAIILPSKYFTNKPEDIQNTFGNFIIVSEKKWVKTSDCTIEVVLTDSEVKELMRVSDHFLLSNIPIPISRVKSVCFLDMKQKETTIWNINNGAAFIPESLISMEVSKNIEYISTEELKTGNQANSAIDLSDKIKRYDIILGGFAFMRLGGKSFMNYSQNYFATLSFFNKLIEEQTNYAANEKGLKFNNKYIGLFSKNESEWTKWLQYIYQNIEPKDIENLAEKEGERIEKRLGLLKIESINPDSHLYELAILATYGDRKNKSTDNLVTDLSNGTINANKSEDVSILFGLNNGYSKLRNKYKGTVKDYNVKFTLESKLDYYILESIFQFVFYGIKTNYTFNYIDTWCPSNKKTDIIKGFITYKILDTNVIAKKKPTPLEEFFERYAPEIYSTIFKSISQWLPPFTKSDEKEAILYFERQLKNALTISIETFQRKIENECESKFTAENNEVIESYKEVIEKLRLEISCLKEESDKFKNLVGPESLTKNLKKSLQDEETHKLDYAKENIEPVNVVQESSLIVVGDIYSTLSITELKKIAKQRGISSTTVNGFKKENKNELIDLIKKTPETPKFL